MTLQRLHLYISQWLFKSEFHRTMDNTSTSKECRGCSNLSRFMLLLFLAGFQPVSSADEQTPALDDNDGQEINCTLVGPDYVTVGVPSSLECDSICEACSYSMFLDGHTAEGNGNVLFFTMSAWMPGLTATCTVTDENTGKTATATKQLQVLVGPSNISLSGPDLLNPSVKHTYSCQAFCRPSCTYVWRTDKGPWVGGQGNVISITPKEQDNFKVITCKATNRVSGMYISASRYIGVITGPSDIQIKGLDVIEIGQTQLFVCTSECLPSCHYVSSLGSNTVRGAVIEITVDYLQESLTIECKAENTASRKTATASKSVQIKAPNRSFGSRPEGTQAVLLLLAVFSAALSL